MTVINLASLSPAEISALVDSSDSQKRGYIEPGIVQAVESGAIASNMSDVITWPKNKDGSVKTVTQQVTALTQNIKNHKVKVLEGKATAWPTLEVFAAPARNGNGAFAMLVNQDLLNAAKAAEAAKAK